MSRRMHVIGPHARTPRGLMGSIAVGALAFVASLAPLTGCPRAHDDLAASGGAGPGPAGAGGATSSASTSDTSATSSATSSSGAGAGGAGGADAGPLPDSKLTIVGGVADYDAVRLCFVPFPSGDDVAPWPADPAGLAFARAAVVDPASVVVGDGDVRIDVVAGDLAATAGKSCAEIRALAAGDAPPIVVRSLPVLPGSAFASHKSLLLVPTGCLGGPDHTGPTDQLGCGTGYSPSTPTAGLVALGMKTDTAKDKLAIQIVHASAAMPTSDVRLTPGVDGAAPLQLAGALGPGEIAPPLPFTSIGRTALEPLPSAKLSTFAPNDTYATSVTTLSTIAANGDLALSDLIDGGGYVFVALGGYPGVAPGAFWHGFTYALVRADP